MLLRKPCEVAPTYRTRVSSVVCAHFVEALHPFAKPWERLLETGPFIANRGGPVRKSRRKAQ